MAAKINYYYCDYEKYRLKIYVTKYLDKQLPQKTLQFFKLEFPKLEVVNVSSVNDLLNKIYKSIMVRYNLNKSFVVTEQSEFIRVSYQKKYFLDIYEK